MKEITGIFFIVSVVIVYVGTLILVPMMIDERTKRRRRETVGKLIANAYSKTPLTRKQIELLSTDHHLVSRDIQILLRNQFSGAVKSGNEALIKYFQELYEELERDEPFEGLPLDLRIHLERIRESIGQEKEVHMLPLASQLQELSAANRKKVKRMWAFTIASFAATVVGVGFGAFPYLPFHDSPSTTTRKDETPEHRSGAVSGHSSERRVQ